ncbi:MAG: zf-HC2 domain-containing protein [Armatimonadota bacterium]
MNCNQIQPNLLDYSRKLLSGREQEIIKAHLRKCPECERVLQEEVALFARLSGIPEEQPRNDVWALVRSRTRRSALPLSRLRGLLSTGLRKKMAAASAAAVLAAIGLYNLAATPPQTPAQPEQKVVVAVYSDDPLGGHTDAVIDSIDKM